MLTRLPVSMLTNPFQLGVAWAAFFLGLGVILTTLVPFFGAFSLVQTTMPALVVLVWAAFLFIGGAGVLMATFGAGMVPPRAAVLEVPSQVLMGSAWMVYAVVPVLSGGALASASFGLCLALACALRVRAIAVAARVTRDVNSIHTEDH